MSGFSNIYMNDLLEEQRRTVTEDWQDSIERPRVHMAIVHLVYAF
jgi:hypothetical protein